jgi:hypothetical protein
VSARSLLAVFPALQDLANVSPEDLGAVIVELAPGMMQNGMFTIHSLRDQLYFLRRDRVCKEPAQPQRF